MDLDARKLSDDPAELKQIIDCLAGNRRRDQERIQYLEEYVRLLKNELFGPKTEKRPVVDDKQLMLFNEAEAAEPAEADKAAETVTVPTHSRRKHGRKPLPADLPRVDVIHDLDESEKVCA